MADHNDVSLFDDVSKYRLPQAVILQLAEQVQAALERLEPSQLSLAHC